jgi:DNA invertase Pin-like site-specific DNA recombinase
MESQSRNERTKAGLARAEAQGKNLGRPKVSKQPKGCMLAEIMDECLVRS